MRDAFDYRTYMNILNAQAAAEKKPISGTFELTTRCNLACTMCYIAEHACNKDMMGKELSAEEWVSILRQASENGTTFATLTGGEIFLRRDFFDIYEPVRDMGLVLTLFSNGTLITKSIASRLAARMPNKIELTIYGASPETYEKVTGFRKGFELCINGIKNLLDAGIEPVVKSTITQDNLNDAEEMEDIVHGLGLPFKKGWLLNKRTDGKISKIEDSRLPAEKILVLEEEIYLNKAEEKKKTEAKPEPRDGIFYCSVGKTSFVINTSGELNACPDLPLPSASVPQKGFPAAWKELVDFVDITTKQKSTCSTCEAKDYCNSCPAWSYLETNKMDEPVPYLCDIAFKRKEKYEGRV